MSFGKITFKKYAEGFPLRPLFLKERKCLNCDKPFNVHKGNNKTQKFCSKICARRYGGRSNVKKKYSKNKPTTTSKRNFKEVITKVIQIDNSYTIRHNLDLDFVEKQTILLALGRTNYIQYEAADLLGVSSRVLNHKIKKHKITHPSWRVNS